MTMQIILCLIGSCLLTLVACGEDYPTDKHTAENDGADQHFFGGLFPGTCTHNGVYIRDAYSLVFCSNRNKYIQPCAPGTRNGPLHAYLPGVKYGPTDFCNVNLVPYGDTPHMYPILQYGGLPLPFRHTEKDGYAPYIFVHKQIYPIRDEPYKHKAMKSGYPHPLDGHKVVETIKDTHLYEKPDVLHGHHGSDLGKDYHAIRQSYKERKKAHEEFQEAYKEVDKEIHDDFRPEYKNEFEKFVKKYNEYEKKAKKAKYKETRYEPPTMKPNKYGEIKDLPPKHKKPKKYEPPRYQPPKDEKDGYNEAPEYELFYPSLKDENQSYGQSPPQEHKAVDEDDREFDKFYNSNRKIKGVTYSEDSYGEYSVGHVEKSTENEKPKKPYSAPLKEEIHGSHYML